MLGNNVHCFNLKHMNDVLVGRSSCLIILFLHFIMFMQMPFGSFYILLKAILAICHFMIRLSSKISQMWVL
jgi:hypothetical protein